MNYLHVGLAVVSSYLIGTVAFFSLYSAITISSAFPLGRMVADWGVNPIHYLGLIVTVTYYLAVRMPLVVAGTVVSNLKSFSAWPIWIRVLFWPVTVAANSLLVNVLGWFGLQVGDASLPLIANEVSATVGLWWLIWQAKKIYVFYSNAFPGGQ